MSPPPDYLISLLVTNAVVVTMDDEGRVFSPGAVAVDQGQILWLGPQAEARTIPAMEVLDAGGGIVCPGLVNTHFETDQQLLGGKLAELLPMATRGGAEAPGPPDTVARLEVGRRADLIVVQAIVVDGRIVMKECRLL